MILRCVLKSGGPYTVEYVQRIHDAIKGQGFKLQCLTDLPAGALPLCEVIPLRHDWPGWWSKIELFRDDLPHDPVVYIDLDTVVLGDLSDLKAVAETVDFTALRGFNQRLKNPTKNQNFASGVMAGKLHKLSHIYESFKADPQRHMDKKRENWRHGDQGYIADCIDIDSIPSIQDLTSRDYIIGKRYLGMHGWRIPKSARLIAWSGKPRLHKINEDHIMSKKWRGR